MECAAIDCDTEHTNFGKYCSDVCMNVHLEVCADAAFKMDGLAAPSDVPDERVAKIREKSQQAHDEINRRMEDATP